MNKKLLLGIGIPVGVVVLGIAALVANSVITTERTTAIENQFKSISTVDDAYYEMLHPGAPTNNSAIVYVVAPVESASQVAKVVEDVYKTAYEANLAKSYTLDVVYVNTAQVDKTKYGDRKTYANFDYKHREEIRNIIKEAQALVGSDAFKNRFQTNKSELDQKFSN